MKKEEIENRFKKLKNLHLIQLVEELNKPIVSEDALLSSLCQEIFAEELSVETMIQMSFFILNEITERFQLQINDEIF